MLTVALVAFVQGFTPNCQQLARAQLLITAARAIEGCSSWTELKM